MTTIQHFTNDLHGYTDVELAELNRRFEAALDRRGIDIDDADATTISGVAEIVEREFVPLDKIPGDARQVYGGWIWVTPGEIEHGWTKRRTADGCEAAVLEACDRLGVNVALEIDEED